MSFHDHLGDTIDPLLAAGVGLYLLGNASGTLAMAAAVVAASLLFAFGVTYQPFRRSSDRLSSEVAERV